MYSPPPSRPLTPSFAEVQVLSLKGLLLFDSALDLSVVWFAPRDKERTRGREGTRLSSQQDRLLNLARAVHQPYPTEDDRSGRYGDQASFLTRSAYAVVWPRDAGHFSRTCMKA